MDPAEERFVPAHDVHDRNARMNLALAPLVLPLLAMASCARGPEDIRVAELRTLCAHVDAMELVLDAALALPGPAPNNAAEKAAVREQQLILQRKYIELRTSAEPFMEKELLTDCPNWARVHQKINEAVGVTD
jgi:hypothetical protein